MRALRVRMDALEQTVADDIDPPVVAIREAQNLDAADQRVADDEMQLATDQLVGALRLEPRRKADFAALGPRRNPRGERRIIGTANGDAGHVKLGHGPPIWDASDGTPAPRSTPDQLH